MSTASVDHPAHYREGGLEVIDIIDAFPHIQGSFNLGNVVKYVLRAGRKDRGTYGEDLRKAAWYLDREIGRLQQ